MLFAAALSNFLIYRFSLNSQFNELRNKLMLIASTASLLIDTDTLSRIPLNREGVNTPQYQDTVLALKKIKKINPILKYIYILTRTDKEGIWQFVADPDPVSGRPGRQAVTSFPGDTYNAGRFPEMLKAFEGPQADTRLESDEWGVTLSGYAPIVDRAGKAVAVLGVDMAADSVYATQKQVHVRAFFVLALGIVLSIGLGMMISKKITKRIEQLVEGTRHVAAGKLLYQVAIKGDDEIAELARSFNQMARSLDESRKRVLSYFYDVVQSLVRILEARDHYTRGHSEKVAEYSEKIALRMGFSSEEAGLLKEIALLHDIGKLGIRESILNKKEKLTDEEWEVIKKHPVIGEDILKPILFTKDMLSIVRAHHERYDGTGYPDKLKGDDIHIFSSILSVADAYDAMTSHRAYRRALSKKSAIEELKANSGTQFNPKVVEAFLKILDEEGGG